MLVDWSVVSNYSPIYVALLCPPALLYMRPYIILHQQRKLECMTSMVPGALVYYTSVTFVDSKVSAVIDFSQSSRGFCFLCFEFGACRLLTNFWPGAKLKVFIIWYAERHRTLLLPAVTVH